MKMAQYIAGRYDLRLKTFVFTTNDTKNFLEDKEYICICNGNIFDKKTFVPMGVDAILKLYKEKHLSFLDEIDGLFSLIFFHKTKKELYIFQDYMSSTLPIYYTVYNDKFFFSTDLKHILASCRMARILNRKLVPCLLKNFCIMNHETLIYGIRKLEPKHYIRIVDGQIGISRIKMKYELDIDVSATSLENILDKYIQNQLLYSDTSIANVALSGGYDSNLILNRTQGIAHHINAFTIGGSYGTDEYDQVVNIVNKTNNVTLYSHVINASDFECVPDMIFRLESATHENGVPLQYFLSKLVSCKQQNNLLCGESADETMFLKYHDDNLKYSIQELSARRIPFRDNPFYSTNLVVLKKSGIFLNSFGICPHYPYKTKQFIAFANAAKEQNNDDKKLYKDFCKLILPSSVSESIVSCGGATDPRAFLTKQHIEWALFVFDEKKYMDIFDWSMMKKNEILSAYDSKEGFEIVSDILSGIFLMSFEQIFMSGMYDEVFANDCCPITMSELFGKI